MAINDGEMTLKLNSPITEEQWDAIMDVDFEHTDRIWFHTKNGKDIEFVKRKKGKWGQGYCSECGYNWGKDAPIASVPNFCPNCGAEMEKRYG